MTDFHWLGEELPTFPDPRETDSEGIVAVGGDLSIPTLLAAYQQGIFPWFNEEQPILWWCPDPRFVLFPSELKVAKSMRSYFNQNKFRITYDTSFERVILACKETRRSDQLYGSWITADMVEGYLALHDAGYAHSVEVWDDDKLVGGLYGVGLGKMFFGESMFALRSNASKMGFIDLVRKLQKRGYQLIDCQQETGHLGSLGAKAVPRNDFLDLLQKLVLLPTDRGSWTEWSHDTTK